MLLNPGKTNRCCTETRANPSNTGHSQGILRTFSGHSHGILMVFSGHSHGILRALFSGHYSQGIILIAFSGLQAGVVVQPDAQALHEHVCC